MGYEQLSDIDLIDLHRHLKSANFLMTSVTEADLEEAKGNPELLAAICRKTLEFNPEACTSIVKINNIQQLFDTEVIDEHQFREALKITLEREPLKLGRSYRFLLPFTTLEQRIQIINIGAESGDLGLISNLFCPLYKEVPPVDTLAVSEVKQAGFDPKQLLIDCIQNADSPLYIKYKQFKNFVDSGLITIDEIPNILISKLGSLKSLHYIAFMEKFTDQEFLDAITPNQRFEIGEAIKQIFRRFDTDYIPVTFNIKVIEIFAGRDYLVDYLEEKASFSDGHNIGKSAMSYFEVKPELLFTWVEAQLALPDEEKNVHALLTSELYQLLLDRNRDFDLDLLQNYVETLFRLKPVLAVSFLNRAVEIIKPIDRLQAVVLELINVLSEGEYSYIVQFYEELSSVVGVDRMPNLYELINSHESPSLRFLNHFNNLLVNAPDSGLFNTLSVEQVKLLVEKAISTDVGKALNRWSEVSEMYSEDEQRLLLDRALYSDPEVFFRDFRKFSYLFESQREFELYIDQILTSLNRRFIAAAIKHMYKWAGSVSVSYITEFIARAMRVVPDIFLKYFQDISKYIEQIKRSEVLELAIRTDPASAIRTLISGSELKGWQVEQVIELALTDENKIQYAPKYLREKLDRIAELYQNDNLRVLDIKDAVDIYQAVALVEASGKTSAYLSYREAASDNTTIKLSRLEYESLQLFHAMIILGDEGIDITDISQCNNLEELQRLTISKVIELMNLDVSLTSDQVGGFIEAFGSPTPLVIYYVQFRESPAHEEFMRSMFLSIVEGKYTNWKYRDASTLKEQSYIPKLISQKQYEVWQDDQELGKDPSQSVDYEYLFEEFGDGYIDQEVLSFFSITSLEGTVPSELNQKRGELGRLLGSISKYMKSAEGLEPTDTGEVTLDRMRAAADTQELQKALEVNVEELSKDDLGNILAHLRDIRSRLEIAISLVEIHNLSESEIIQGRFEDGSKIQSKIEKAISHCEKLGLGLTLNSLNTLAKRLQSSVRVSPFSSTYDTSSAHTGMTIGSNPVSSCLHYVHGANNHCLLGTLGPDTKVLLVSNRSSQPVSRSIMRLLDDNDGNPAIHVEMVYSAHDEVTRSIVNILARAVEKSEQINSVDGDSEVKVYISEIMLTKTADADDPDVVLKELELAGFEIIKRHDTSLHSEASPAPFVYVDSAGGIRPEGQYSIPSGSLYEVRRAKI